MTTESSRPLYPVSVKLDGRRCLVVGGGAMARRKAEGLRACGALVLLVAPEWRDDFAGLEAGGGVTRITRAFLESDLDGAFLVIAATDDPDVQERVSRAANVRGLLCNVVDVNPLCSFYVPATLRRGALAVSVVTDGKFPLLAVALRDWLAGRIGAQFGPALDRLAEARATVKRLYPADGARRASALRALLSPRALDALIEDRSDEFEEHRRTWRSSLQE